VVIRRHDPWGMLDVEPDDRAGSTAPQTGTGRQDRSPRRFPLDILAAIALGGVIGTAGRYAVAEAVPVADDGFPTATFLVNVLGAFLLGIVVVLSLDRLPPSRYLRPFVATGIMGAFTTFSTFAVEAVLLVDHDRAALAAAYVGATLAVGLTAAWLGIVAARSLPRRPSREAS
jgi:fluoride exporter